ncbi:MAG: glycosyltransferase, partial [bacterium]
MSEVSPDVPAVGIVVINWHKPDATRACLAALARLTYPRHSVVVVDNGSDDFNAAEIDRLAPGGQYLRSDTNLGFAGGANLGMSAALARGADWVWFLNNDALPEEQALSALVDAAT